MPNTLVPALGGAMPAWMPTAPDVARAILNTVTRSLDGMRAEVEAELVEHARCRRDVEALIERLIDGLDAIDAFDEDREDFDEGDPLDDGEAINEDGDDSEHDISTQAETYGRGWDSGAVEAVEREDLFSDTVRPGLFISWKAGRCMSAAFVPNEGRAGS